MTSLDLDTNNVVRLMHAQGVYEAQIALAAPAAGDTLLKLCTISVLAYKKGQNFTL